MSQTNQTMRKVLIVDDEDLTRVLLSQVIERLAPDMVSIMTAEDGQEAIQIALNERPDLILLDVLLPKMNGYDVCRQLRDIPSYDPYIIILTARGQNTDREQAQSIGANDFMTKPFSTSRLSAQLSELWGLH